jgi:chemotaxis protein methyltransferase CheR
MFFSEPDVMMSEEEFRLIRDIIYSHCGLFFDSDTKYLLEKRLSRRLQLYHLQNFKDYHYFLKYDRKKDQELSDLMDVLTTNETYFFREAFQLKALTDEILPELKAAKEQKGEKTLRIWSAGCSSGQEAYSVAILICDALAYYYLRNPLPFDMPSPKPLIPPPWKLEILASDISYASLRAGQDGVYTEQQMEPVDYTCRLRYFEKSADKYGIKPQLKELVQFDFHNLKTEFLPRRNDMILCRNVMIYFDEAEQKRLIDKFYNCLNPGGYLFVGHAESLFGLTQKFRMVHENNGTAYQRVEVNS